MKKAVSERLLAGESPQKIAKDLGLMTATDHDGMSDSPAVIVGGWEDYSVDDIAPMSTTADEVFADLESDLEPEDETHWVTFHIWLPGLALADGLVEEVRCNQAGGSFETAPEEPECSSAGGHDWRDGDPHGHGGGVIYTDTCRRCDLRRTTDTWATNDEGEQGLTSVRYDPPGEDD